METKMVITVILCCSLGRPKEGDWSSGVFATFPTVPELVEVGSMTFGVMRSSKDKKE